MSTEIVRVSPAEMAEITGYEERQIDVIKNTIAKGATDEELLFFLNVSKRTGLDPFAKQIYFVKRYDNQLQRDVGTPQTGIDGYRLIADRTGAYTPGREPTFTYADNSTVPHTATAYVKKFVGGIWHEVSATAFWAEYVQTKRDGSPMHMWKKMPHTMLAKCAEALALRRAFPAELSGLYTSDEMGQAQNEAIVVDAGTGEVIERPAPQPRTAQPPPQTEEERALIASIKAMKAALVEIGLDLPGSFDQTKGKRPADIPRSVLESIHRDARYVLAGFVKVNDPGLKTSSMSDEELAEYARSLAATKEEPKKEEEQEQPAVIGPQQDRSIPDMRILDQ